MPQAQLRVQARRRQSLPVFQFSRIQFSRSSSSWSRSLEIHTGVSILEAQFWILKGVQDFPPRLPAWHAPPLGELPAPKFGYLASSWRSCAPSCAILAHLGALGPHLVAKLLQDGAQLAQHSPTSRQDEPTWPPRAPPRPQKTFKNCVFSMFSAIWHLALKI